MYSQFYGFSEKPFDITPDPRFLYSSLSHREALASLIYGIKERRGFMAILGEAGTGKTTLLRSALDRLKEDVKVAYIFNTDVNFAEMLQMILVDLGLASRKDMLTKVEAFHRLNNLAIQQLSVGGNVVIMVDEAQNLDRACLENLRLLSNLETRKHKLIQIVLSGQPELEERLKRPDLRQLSQRINLRRRILPLEEQDTYAYIEQRLRVVGYSGPPLFTRKAERLLWRASGGIPRIINTVCDNSLLIAFALKERKIQAKTVKEAIADLGQDRSRKVRESEGKPAGRRAGAFLLLLISFMTLLAAAGFGIYGIQWKPKDSLSSHHNTVRAAISQTEEKDSEGSAMDPQEVPPVVAALPSPSPEPVLFAESMEPSSSKEEEEGTKAGGGAIPERFPPEEVKFITVQEGDTLHDLIVRHYGRYNWTLEQKVLSANPSIENPNLIFISQRINLPDP
jgi:general secretion pathway protein A